MCIVSLTTPCEMTDRGTIASSQVWCLVDVTSLNRSLHPYHWHDNMLLAAMNIGYESEKWCPRGETHCLDVHPLSHVLFHFQM